MVYTFFIGHFLVEIQSELIVHLSDLRIQRKQGECSDHSTNSLGVKSWIQIIAVRSKEKDLEKSCFAVIVIAVSKTG